MDDELAVLQAAYVKWAITSYQSYGETYYQAVRGGYTARADNIVKLRLMMMEHMMERHGPAPVDQRARSVAP